MFTIRAVAIQGNVASDIVTRNFVMGTDVFSRFCEDTLIFAITSDPHGLFDYYDGIFVEGVDRVAWRENYFRENNRMPYENPASPANFNRRGRESEREAHVEMFDHTGEVHISQRIGIRVRGGFSRAVEEQKSMELYAREEYGDRNNFRFSFFDNEIDFNGNIVDRYRRIRLRNGGSDRQAGFIRDELSQTLFRQAGHTTTQAHRPAAVFLNGDYYGVAWLKSPRTENHLARMFGGNSDQFDMVEGGDRRDHSWWSGTHRAAGDFNAVHRLARSGFTGDNGESNFQEFSRRVCVDSLIRYYAMQIYINNLDWPNHNFELWRYFPTQEEMDDETLHPYLRDGKWRVFTHDLESAWAIWDNYDQTVLDDTMHDILTGTGNRWNSSQSSAFLHGFISRDDTRAHLANAFIDLIEGAFAPQNVIDTLNWLEAQIINEHTYALQMDYINPGEFWWPTTYTTTDSRDAIRRFAVDRPQVMLRSIEHNLGFNRNNRYSVTLTVEENGSAMMHSRPVAAGQTVTGNYFANTQIKITAIPHAGYTVNEWLVNGARRTGDSITVDRSATVSVSFRAG
jgi:hypothetical protein